LDLPVEPVAQKDLEELGERALADREVARHERLPEAEAPLCQDAGEHPRVRHMHGHLRMVSVARGASSDDAIAPADREADPGVGDAAIEDVEEKLLAHADEYGDLGRTDGSSPRACRGRVPALASGPAAGIPPTESLRLGAHLAR